MRPLVEHVVRVSLLLGAGAVVALLAACRSMDIDQFAGAEPSFRPETYFPGRSEGWGVMQDRFGNLLRQFRIEAYGEWNADDQVLSLHETYTFTDGQVDRLEWQMRPVGGDRYEGTEPRLEGVAEGVRAGNTFHWRYVRRVPQQDGRERTLFFDDWFWLQDDRVLIVRASVRRFRIELATLSVFYRKLDDPPAPAHVRQ
jgi:hypothetical protein